MSLLSILEKIPGYQGLEELCKAISDEAHRLESQYEELKAHVEEHLGEMYTPDEYPKMLSNGKTANNAEEEARLTDNVETTGEANHEAVQ